ncbi:hypothetical protein DYH55_16305 [Methylovirgula sp. 4M-Z18]|nr:hypothetical protein DYH55_16305 [Methylovirgula sp. 4M-Z18]
MAPNTRLNRNSPADDGYGLMRRDDASALTRNRSQEQHAVGGPSPSAPQKQDEANILSRYSALEVEMVAQALADRSLTLPASGSIGCEWSDGDPPRYRATHIHLPPLPTMTVEEAVKRGLVSITGGSRGAYLAEVKAMQEEMRACD